MGLMITHEPAPLEATPDGAVRGWRIGIGGSLTTPPLPHHRTYGSRIRRFGGLSD